MRISDWSSDVCSSDLETLGTATEVHSHRSYGGARGSLWLDHVTVSRQATGRPLLTPGEVMQLPVDEELVMVAGHPPLRARKLRYYADRNFTSRVLPPPVLSNDGYADRPGLQSDDWGGQVIAAPEPAEFERSEGSRVGKECVSTLRTRWAPAH